MIHNSPFISPMKESHLRQLSYLFVIILLIACSFLMVTVAQTLRQTQKTTQPISDLMQQLFIEATPVILPDPVIIVHEINELARLETASMELEKVIRAERDQDLLWGALGETLIFVAYGEVIAGVDLAKMQPADMQVIDPDTVMVYLPDAEIFVATLNNQRSYVANRDTGILTNSDPTLETQVRQAAEQEILEAALEAGILGRANQNAESYMKTFLTNLGFENVIFTDAPPPPAPPYEQEIPKGYTLTPAP